MSQTFSRVGKSYVKFSSEEIMKTALIYLGCYVDTINKNVAIPRDLEITKEASIWIEEAKKLKYTFSVAIV